MVIPKPMAMPRLLGAASQTGMPTKIRAGADADSPASAVSRTMMVTLTPPASGKRPFSQTSARFSFASSAPAVVVTTCRSASSAPSRSVKGRMRRFMRDRARTASNPIANATASSMAAMATVAHSMGPPSI